MTLIISQPPLTDGAPSGYFRIVVFRDGLEEYHDFATSYRAALEKAAQFLQGLIPDQPVPLPVLTEAVGKAELRAELEKAEAPHLLAARRYNLY